MQGSSGDDSHARYVAFRVKQPPHVHVIVTRHVEL